MLRKYASAYACISIFVAIILISSESASTQTAGSFVALQASTPGSSQNGNVNISGTLIAGGHIGNGGGLTQLNADNIATGTLSDSRIPNNIVRTGQTQTITGSKTFSGVITFTSVSTPFSVTSLGLVSNLNADLLDGQHGVFYRDASNISDGLLAPMFGGTGINSATAVAGSILYTSGFGTWGILAPGANGQILKLSGGVPLWSDSTTNGPASGDLSGTFPNPSVIAIRGRSISASAPSSGNVLKWNGSAWAPQVDNDSGLVLPYDGTTSTTANVAALKISNVTATGVTYGLWTENSSTSGTGILSVANALSGITTGVLGRSNSPDGRGVHGFAAATTGTNYGVYGRSDSAAGNGMYGWATSASSGVGVHGISAGSTGIGVKGVASATSGVNFGGFFTGSSPSGMGVYSSGAIGITAEGLDFGGEFRGFTGMRAISVASAGFGVIGLAYGANSSGGSFHGELNGIKANGSQYGGEFSGHVGLSSDGITIGGLFTGSTGIQADGYLLAASFEGADGIHSIGDSVDGVGVVGESTGANGKGGAFYGVTGVLGSSIEEGGVGVAGHSTDGYGGAFSSNVVGIYASGETGEGVRGISLNSYGGYFSSDNAVALFADGLDDDAIVSNTGQVGKSGIYARHTATTGAGYGVYGQSDSPASGYGVYSAGRFAASGTKAFRIDHPYDPANMFLNHYCAEGPEPLNMYTGNVITDAKGCAWVELPEYFTEINKDFRYTLTVVDDTDSESFVMAKIAREIVANRFKIRTSSGNVKVSWRVDAVRNDRWMRAYGAPVETSKQGTEKGRFVNPELFGEPEGKSLKVHHEVKSMVLARVPKSNRLGGGK